MLLKVPLYYALARYRRYRKFWPGVADNYAKLVSLQPHNKAWRVSLAEALYRSKRFNTSLKVSEKALELFPTQPSLVVVRFKSLHKLGKNDRVVNEIEKKLSEDIDPSLVEIYAHALLASGKEETAKAQYEKLAIHYTSKCDWPKLSDVYYQLADIAQQSGDVSRATELYNLSMINSPSARVKQLGLGELHQRHQNPEAALNAYLDMARKKPENQDLWFEIGKTYSRLRDMVNARDAYKKFMELEQNNHGKLKENLVVFEAYRGRSYACSPKAIYEYMAHDNKYKNFRFIWVIRGTSYLQHWRLYISPRTQVVRYKSKDYFRAYGQAKYWITNMRLNFIEKASKDQQYIQCWHGTPFKKMGYSVENSDESVDGSGDERWYDDDSRQTDYFLAQSHMAAGYFDEAFGLSRLGKDTILTETGYPRNDVLYRVSVKGQNKIKRKLGLPDNKKILLYAPTWRDDEFDANRGYVHDITTDFSRLQARLGNEWIILYRAHYLIARGFDFEKYDGFVRDVSAVEDINDLYIISDALMTDYSSVFFDYANLDRPIIFYMYDLKKYQAMRGFYMKLSELPGEVVSNEAEIISILEDISSYRDRYSTRYNNFKDKYISLDDGHAAERVVKLFVGGRK